MICFNCGATLTSSEFCTNCGMKVTVYKKLIRMSNTYYNMGLLKAKNRDLSGAADILRRSLRLNKRNTKARNLLGLVYYEMGEIVQAFSEWLISVNFRPERNPANNYLEQVKANPNKLEMLNSTIQKFNVSLNYAKKGMTDVAIIQLKKVLQQNPHLIKGQQLMALLYMKIEDYDHARRVINKILSIDRCNPLALRYREEVEEALAKRGDRRIRPQVKQDQKALSGNDVIIPSHFFVESQNGAVTILKILFGVILGALAVYVLVTPVKVRNEVEKSNDIVLEYDQKLAVSNSTQDELSRQVSELTTERDNLASQVESLQKEDDTEEANYNHLIAAYYAYDQSDFDTASEEYAAIDTGVTISSEAYNTVYNLLNTELASAIKEKQQKEAMTAYGQGNYEEAIELFKECIKADEDYEEGYYRIAYAYYNLGDSENSEKYFQMIIDNFPNGEYAEKAKNYVSSSSSSEDTGDSEE